MAEEYEDIYGFIKPAQTKIGSALQFPLKALEGLGNIGGEIAKFPIKLGENVFDYLASPSEYAIDVSENQLKPEYRGIDLADIAGSGVGVPDFAKDSNLIAPYFTDKQILESIFGKNQPKPFPENFEELKRSNRAEAFRRNEAELAEMAGLNSTLMDDIAKDLADLKTPSSSKELTQSEKTAEAAINKKMGMDALAPNVTQDTIENAAMAAFNDYLEAARGAGPDTPKVKDIDEYKEEFAKATGIDISGNVDKSHALMTFGLALMQNKAGRGFNVGKMLASVGEAGTAALPALEAARKETRANALAAGKYALEARSADETKAAAAREKAMERSDYFVVPKSDDVKGFLAGLGEGRGRLESLSKYEVDKLLKNPEFAKKFDILPGATWATVVEEALKTPEAKEYYQTSPREVTLYEGTDAELSFQVYDPTANAAMAGVRPFTYQSKEAYDTILDQLSDLEEAEREWADITAQIQEKGVNVYTQTLDGADALFEAFGINFREGATPTARLRNFLTRIQMQNAPEILGEAGKTISDADRDRVAQIVGDVSLLTSEDDLLEKMEQVHKFILKRTRQNIMRNLRTIDRYSPNSNFSQYLQGDESMSDEEKDRLAAYNKKYGYGG